MNAYRPDAVLLPALLSLTIVACGATVRETAGPADGVPGGTAEVGTAEAGAVAGGATRADVRFIHAMIAHHAQALEMTELVTDRAASEDIRRLALRIEISQEDEIARMRRWLEARGEADAAGHAHGPGMPGMLTEDEMARLAGATGAEFDRLFLELMIRHHEGALAMLRELHSVEGAGQEPELFQLISHIDADQRAEIARMRGILGTTPEGGTE